MSTRAYAWGKGFPTYFPGNRNSEAFLVAGGPVRTRPRTREGGCTLALALEEFLTMAEERTIGDLGPV